MGEMYSLNTHDKTPSTKNFFEKTKRRFVSEAMLWGSTMPEAWGSHHLGSTSFLTVCRTRLWVRVRWVGAPVSAHRAMAEPPSVDDQIVELRPKLLAAVRCWVGPERAEDITQDTIHRALKNRDSLRDHPNLLAWLKRTARNRFIDLIRKENFLSTTELAVDVPDESTNLDDLEALKQAVDSLPRQEREVFLLYQAGYGFDPIGKRLRMATSTAFNRYKSARKLLMKKLGYPEP